MKRLYLFLLLTCLAHTGRAKSDYHPFIEEGKVWHCTTEGEALWILHDSTSINHIDYTLQGDTVIAGRACKALSGYFIYEEDRKVYAYGRGDGQFHLIYDFSCNVGDVIEVGSPFEPCSYFGYYDMAGSWSYVSSCTVGKSEFFVYDDIFFGTDDIRAIEHRDNTPGIGNASHSDYDLTGRRVTSPRRGICIVNGRKVVVSCGAIRLKVAE